MLERDRRRSISVAVSFGNREDLVRLGSGAATLTCPECGAVGTRYGNPGEDLRFEGFEPLTRGGRAVILLRCDGCSKDVTLPHTRA